jgi:RNA recognition motif-containing protein
LHRRPRSASFGSPTGARSGSAIELTNPKGGSVISSKLFVGNLNYTTTADELETLFSEAGEVVEVILPADRATGRPRGFGFVEFADEAAAAAAIQRFDGHQLGGREIRVNEAQERPARSPRMPFSSGGGGRPSGPPPSKPKGSRRNLRGRKRSL